MKNKFLTLMKVDLRETLDFRKFKNNKVKSTSFLTVLILVGLLFLGLSTIYNLIFTAAMVESGKFYVSAMLMGGVASIVCISTSIFRVKSIFTGKDYEMLRTMPIKKRDIIASKLVNLYLVETAYAMIFLLPNCVVCALFSHNYLYILFGIVYGLLITGLPIIISAIFSALISLVADRFRYKGIVSIILYTVFFAAVFAFSFTMGMASNPEQAVEIYENLGNVLAYINPTIFLYKMAFTSNYLYIFLYIAATLLALFAGILFISLFFDKVYESVNSVKAGRKYVRKELSAKGQFKALFNLEAKRLFSSKMYFINCISSIIMSILLSVMMGISLKEVLAEVMDLSKYAYAFSLIPIFSLGVSTVASSSISIEGKNLWLVKTLPIDYHKWINVKMLLSLLFSLFGSIVSSIILVVFLKPSITSSVGLIMIPALFVALVTSLSLYINLYYNKFNWNNEREVVKNSASVTITLLIDWGITILLAAMIVGLSFINVYLSIILTGSVLLLGAFIFYRLSHGAVESRVQKFGEE